MADAQRHTFQYNAAVPGVCWRPIPGTNNVCGRLGTAEVHQIDPTVADAQRGASGGGEVPSWLAEGIRPTPEQWLDLFLTLPRTEQIGHVDNLLRNAARGGDCWEFGHAGQIRKARSWVDHFSGAIGEASSVILALCCAAPHLANSDVQRWEAAAMRAEAWVAKYIDGSEDVDCG